jgi:diaminohydroxyphosphoribosylaminopyrimidine deaminase / 5-amino-6-(5-phosphoribosylamino)uracil reductase
VNDSYTAADYQLMARALVLAERGLTSAHPNPRVGCVIAQDGTIVGEGWHARTGDPHAEMHALRAAGERARGACAYVTLEPCAHHGRTPPCADALIAAGVTRVVAAMRDPDPRTAGAGLERLRAAGIDVEVGLLEREATALNAGFVRRMTRGLPRVTVKVAASLDGRVALANGMSHWITGEAARADVQRLRAASGAVLTGIGTVLADDPRLDVRIALPVVPFAPPLRVILDSALRTPPTARMLTLPGETLILARHDGERRAALEGAGARVEIIPAAPGEGRVDPQAALRLLASLGVNDVLVEAGPHLSGSLLERGLVDRLIVYLAPHLLGARARTMLELPAISDMADRYRLERRDVRVVGVDLCLEFLPLGRGCEGS